MTFSRLNAKRLLSPIFVTCVLSLAIATPGESAQGWTFPGNIDHQTIVQIADGDIVIAGKIDGSSRVTLTSTHGSIIIHGKVDGSSVVVLHAKQNIDIGTQGAPDDQKIDGESHVSATAGNRFRLGNRIDGPTCNALWLLCHSKTFVSVRAGGDIDVMDKIDGPTEVHFCTSAGGSIHIHGKLGPHAIVYFWPSNALAIDQATEGSRLADSREACGRSGPPPPAPRSLDDITGGTPSPRPAPGAAHRPGSSQRLVTPVPAATHQP